ncbi:MAG TPA: vitamin K epoxide reductase family protein [Candidatus Saccharimonadales bacterium]|nr:vitamin K epoxide reductase family protein [Candidatus Saccharimonadales bacterium]
MSTKKQAAVPTRLERVLPWLLLIGGFIGIICSFIITNDKMQLLQNPHFQPNCNLNPIISCGSVMKSSQGSLFGFPNPWIGLAAFGVVTTVGAAMLAGARFARWFWLGLEAGIIGGLAFAYWLLFESVYRIKALCPYCLTVDVVVITLFWYVTMHILDTNVVTVPAGKATTVYQWIRRHHLDILIAWFLVLIALILQHFWYYYGKYL